VITGVMQISKESIFSGLNNLEVNNIFSKDFDEMFGFTNDEVKAICEEYSHPEKYEEAKEWYDGYRFGNTEVYNPWSVLKYVKSGFDPQAYWAGTSGNSIINSLLDCADESVFEELTTLSQGETVRKAIDSTITLEDINGNPDNIYSVMVLSGYLNAVPIGRSYEISLPNGEMYQVFGDLIAKYVSRRFGDADMLSKVRQFSDAVVDNDPEALEKALYGIFAGSLSALILDHEHVYQSAMAMLLMNLSGKYRIKAERENGKGRLDFILEPKVQTLPHIVIELKRLGQDESESKLHAAAEEALKQIREKDYIFGMKGRIFMYGIAFKGMDAKVVSETMAG
ncbi:MAG: AAA family ATPase, partial [Candidatus Methanomethylophilaceae archaeon]|nr:AAA family ATPase [Candidatus Methanomethylophilaceae archaeon]